MKLSIRFIIDALLRRLRFLGLQACDEAAARNRDNVAVKKTPSPASKHSEEKAEQP